MTADFPTAPTTYGLNEPSAAITVEKSPHASHTEILTLHSCLRHFSFVLSIQQSGEYKKRFMRKLPLEFSKCRIDLTHSQHGERHTPLL